MSAAHGKLRRKILVLLLIIVFYFNCKKIIKYNFYDPYKSIKIPK